MSHLETMNTKHSANTSDDANTAHTVDTTTNTNYSDSTLNVASANTTDDVVSADTTDAATNNKQNENSNEDTPHGDSDDIRTHAEHSKVDTLKRKRHGDSDESTPNTELNEHDINSEEETTDHSGTGVSHIFKLLSGSEERPENLLHMAVEQDLCIAIPDLISAGYSANHICDKYTPLGLAGRLKHVRTLRILLESGADPLALNMNGQTVLYDILEMSSFYARLGNISPICDNIVSILLEHVQNVNFLNTCRYFRHYLKRQLYNSQEDANCSLLIQLLDKGLYVDMIMNVNNNFRLIHFAVAVLNSEYLKLLLERGADVNALDCRKNTPLHICQTSYREMEVYSKTEILLQYGSILYFRNSNNETPLDCSLDHRPCDYNVHILLLKHGSDLWSDFKTTSLLYTLSFTSPNTVQVVLTALKAGLQLSPQFKERTEYMLDICRTMPFKDWIDVEHVDHFVKTPVSQLQRICIIYIRRYLSVVNLGRSIIESINTLHMPPVIISQLLLE